MNNNNTQGAQKAFEIPFPKHLTDGEDVKNWMDGWKEGYKDKLIRLLSEKLNEQTPNLGGSTRPIDYEIDCIRTTMKLLATPPQPAPAGGEDWEAAFDKDSDTATRRRPRRNPYEGSGFAAGILWARGWIKDHRDAIAAAEIAELKQQLNKQ